MLALSPWCFTVIVYIYIRIYVKVLRHRRPGSYVEEQNQVSINKASKALITTLLNLGTFIITWLPLCLFQVTMIIQVQHAPKAVFENMLLLAEVDKYLFALLMLNAIADPIIYAVRIHEVKVGLSRLFLHWPCYRLVRTSSTTSSMSMSDVRSRVCSVSLSSMPAARSRVNPHMMKSEFCSMTPLTTTTTISQNNVL